MSAIPILLTCQMLAELTNPLIIDVRPHEAYSQARLPGAIHFDVESLSEERGGVGNMLKPANEIVPLLEQAGIDPDRHIVIYGSNTSLEDVMPPARMFWILEYLGYDMVSVLNGGFAQWAAEGRDVVAGVATRPPVALTDSGVQERLLASMREVRAAIGDASTALLDVRPEPFYTGEEKKDYVPKAGHIESAVNLPPGALVEGETFLVKEPEAIGEALEEYLAPVEEAEDAIVYCNSGKTSAFGYLVLRYAQGRHDFVNLSVYDGSMRQWTSKGGKAMQLESAASR